MDNALRCGELGFCFFSETVHTLKPRCKTPCRRYFTDTAVATSRNQMGNLTNTAAIPRDAWISTSTMSPSLPQLHILSKMIGGWCLCSEQEQYMSHAGTDVADWSDRVEDKYGCCWPAWGICACEMLSPRLKSGLSTSCYSRLLAKIRRMVSFFYCSIVGE